MDQVLAKVKSALLLALSAMLLMEASGLELTACRTNSNQLRVDCTFTQTEQAETSYCQFLQDGKMLGSTQPGVGLVSEQADRVNVTMQQPNVCRLSIAGISGTTQEHARTYTCRVLPGTPQEKGMALHPVTLLPCSAISLLLHTPRLLLAVMSLPVLLGPLIAY